MRFSRSLSSFPGVLALVGLCVAPSIAQIPAVTGSFTQTGNGVTAHAKIFWETPDKLKIEVERDDKNLVPAQIILARGNQTRIWEPATGRLFNLPYNVAVEWWRGWNLQHGGPANLLLGGAENPAALAAFATPEPLPPNLPAGSRVLALKDKTEGLIHRRDRVLFGGGGDRSFYAAHKVPDRLFPDWIILSSGPEQISRQESALGYLNTRINVTLAPGSKLPQSATVNERGSKFQYAYQWEAAAGPLPQDTFTLPAAANAAPAEDIFLSPTSAYPDSDATSLHNRAAAAAVGSEDFEAAHKLWDEARRLAPGTSAPLLAGYEAAVAQRDPALAETYLKLLTGTGLAGAEVQVRRARVSLLRRQYQQALTEVDAARQEAPANPALALLRAQVLRNLGRFNEARDALTTMLNEDGAGHVLKVEAAELLASLELPGTAEQLRGKDDFSQLAQALLLLRNNQTPAVASLATDAALVSLAQGFERAGRDDDARLAWSTLEGRADDATRNLARAHLVALFASRGDVAGSLRTWRDWVAGLRLESEREAAHRAFLAAWQKSFRTETLRGTLQNRSLATGATSEELRLWLTWQELYGTPEEAAVVVEAGAARFPEDPYWLARKAEEAVAKASEQRSTPTGLAQRDRYFNEALQLLDKAVAAAPDQPFYAMQRTLVTVRRGSTNKLVIDAGRATAYRNAARASLDQLLKLWPRDPDAMLCAALGYYSLGTTENIAMAGRLAQSALGGPPQDGNRHELISAARQSLAAFARSARRPSEAAAQFEALLYASATAEEQAGIAASFLALLAESGGGAPQAAAQWLGRLAASGWEYPYARLVLENAAQRTAAAPELAAATFAALSEQEGGAAVVAQAALANAVFLRANAAVQQQGAPPAADRALALATQNFSTAYGKLAQVITGPDPVLAARAAALLGEHQKGEEALATFQQALAAEPTEAALHLTVVDSLQALGKTEEARKARDRALLTLASTTENNRRLSLASLRLGDGQLAWKLASEALHTAQYSPNFEELTFQRIAFAAGRAAFSAGQTAKGAEIFNGLALPQWNNVDRAAALADLSLAWQLANRAEEAAKIAPRISALGLTAEELATAQAFLETIDD